MPEPPLLEEGLENDEDDGLEGDDGLEKDGGGGLEAGLAGC